MAVLNIEAVWFSRRLFVGTVIRVKIICNGVVGGRSTVTLGGVDRRSLGGRLLQKLKPTLFTLRWEER